MWCTFSNQSPFAVNSQNLNMVKSIRETRCKTLCVNSVVFIVPGFFLFLSSGWRKSVWFHVLFSIGAYFTNFKLLGFQFDAFRSIYIGLYWMIYYYCGVDPIHCAAIATWNFKSIKNEIRIHIVEGSQCVRGENEKDSHMKWSFCEKKNRCILLWTQWLTTWMWCMREWHNFQSSKALQCLRWDCSNALSIQ